MTMDICGTTLRSLFHCQSHPTQLTCKTCGTTRPRYRLPWPGQLTIEDDLLGYHNNNICEDWHFCNLLADVCLCLYVCLYVCLSVCPHVLGYLNNLLVTLSEFANITIKSQVSHWLHSLSNLDLSDEIDPVRWKRMRSSGCGNLVFSSAQSAADHAGARQHRWAWLSQIFLRCVGADQIWLWPRSFSLRLI